MAYGLRGVLAAAVGGLMLPALASAQSAYWFRHVDGVQHLADFGDAVAHGPAGTVSLAGTSRDTNDSWTLVTVRYAADGTRLWTRTYRGTPSGFHNDSAVDVGVDAAGNTYTLGSSWGGLRPAGSE
ncbi:MAG TPA: hypothetical protein VD963_04455, partial [Phycisphaerales bacterium]|nr:hypothetical protein [Phycisphaerales bacterium]